MRTWLAIILTFGIAGAALANEPVDKVNQGLCLELKADGISKPCNNDMLLQDDGKGSIDFITGFTGDKGAKKTVVNFQLTQKPDLENSYGYAFPVRGLKFMTFDDTSSTTWHVATGMCFMVKPSPVKAGKRDVRQDIVMMCSATTPDANAKYKRIDWKFVH